MKLSEINNDTLKRIWNGREVDNNIDYDFTDEQIATIVFSEVYDDGEPCDVAVVFGNSDMIKERTEKAVEMYSNGRVKKILFTGGMNGVTSKENQNSEAEQMANLAIQLGIPKEDILIENHSNNTFENIEYAIQLLQDNMPNRIMLISSDFHLKRCYAIFLKYWPNKEYSLVGVKNGYSDEENWMHSDLSWGTGRSIVTYEANALIEYAKNGKIMDLTIENYPTNQK